MSSISKRPSVYAWLPLALLAITAPTLLAHHEPPSVTFYNQVLALFGWGLWTAALIGPVMAGQSPARPLQPQPMWALGAVLLLNATLALAGPWATGLPWGLSMMGAGMALSALLVFGVAWRVGLSAQGDRVFDVFCEALAWAGVIGMALALIQVFHPAWADGLFIAEPTMPGRAVGNLRQPNHFSTLLIWSCCAAAWLGARGRWPMPLAILAMALMIGGVVLTASRTGMVAMLFLAVWGWRDRELPKRLRVALMAAPLIYAAAWGGMWLWSHADKSVSFAADARLHDGSDISSSRFKIWANVLDLIKAQPWTGVGYGEFNVAWTLTPFPTRPVAFFDHTHNLLLQWAVEFGLPLAVLLVGLSLWAWWGLVSPKRAGSAKPGEAFAGTPAGATAVIVSIVGLHSLLEYPLWYSYFLLPTAFAWGMGLAARSRPAVIDQAEPVVSDAPLLAPAKSNLNTALWGAALAVSIVTAWCAWDYQAAANIYAPREGAGPLAERIKFGQRMPWFAYQADYADVTGVDEDEPSKPPMAFSRTLHNLVDARLMMAYARSLAEYGKVDQGRFVVARLKEFRNASAKDFLAVCKEPLEPGQALPFQCEAPQRSYTWRELLPY
ncbi:MAG: polymerase [Rubrivivax sp.]|nr:MAG: polymerase [Rubrivivax sp.]